MGNTSQAPLVLRYARGKLVGYALGGFAFAAVAAWLIASGETAYGSFKQAVVAFGVVFFGGIGLYAVGQMFNRQPVVVISGKGIEDRRLSASVIPWPAILDIEIREMHRQKILMLQLDPAFERTMKATRGASFCKPLNSAIGYQGLPLTIAGLDSSFDDVVEALKSFGTASGKQLD